MPQLFQVLKCFKCSVFQVHQTKKASKWECKLCGEKQSIKRHYGIGTAKECRLHVQKLNGIRGDIDEASETSQLNKSSDEEPEIPVTVKKPVRKPYKNSKWSKFADKEADEKQNTEESIYLGNTEVVLGIPAKKRKKFKPPIVAVEDQPNSSAITIMSLDYEPVEPVFTQTEVTKPEQYANSFFKNNKFKLQAKITKPVAPSFGRAKENIQSSKQKISTESNINDSFQISKEPKNQVINDTKTYVCPKVNKSSKWAEYAEDEENQTDNVELINSEYVSQDILTNPEIIEQESQNMLCGQEITPNVSFSSKAMSENVPLSQKKSTNNNTKQIFSLCDESELDDVLHF